MLAFGMPTLLEIGSVERCASLCQELKLDFVELNMNLPQYQLDQVDSERFREIARQYRIGYTIHLDENLNVSDFNPYIAEGCLRTARETIALVKVIQAPIVNMHLVRGVYFTLPERRVYLFDQYRDRYLQSIENFRLVCERAVGDSEIRVCVENCEGFLEFQREALDILLASPVFGLTLDVGHSHGCGGTDETYMAAKQCAIAHMHLHDAMGRQNHLPLGTGEVDLGKYLALARERQCRVVLETKTVEGLKRSVDWLRNSALEAMNEGWGS